MIVQKIRKEFTQMEMAMAYYSILLSLNKVSLTQRELQLLAITAVKGSTTYPAAREEFCALYETTQPTVNNLISRLRKLKLFVKESNKIRVNPVVALPFTESMIVQISLKWADEGKKELVVKRADNKELVPEAQDG